MKAVFALLAASAALLAAAPAMAHIVVYTDIGRDGMMAGVNIEATVKLAQAVRIPINASGGVHNLADVEALCAVQDEGIEGVICGRSIYEGTLDLTSAQVRADEQTEGADA